MHLKNTQIVQENNYKEIYVRDVNRELELKFFLMGNVYWCKYAENSDIKGCTYFAPALGSDVTYLVPGSQQGVSYIAKIVNRICVNDLITFKREVSSWVRDALLIKDLKVLPRDLKKDLKTNGITILFLGKPHLLFNPPLLKSRLQRGRGFMAKHYHSFDDFFRAAGTHEATCPKCGKNFNC